MDIIPLDATLVKGSHGHINTTTEDRPLLASQNTDLLPTNPSIPTNVIDVILAHLSLDDS